MSAYPIDQLTEIAHHLWCERMAAEGWRHGSVYDPAARLHDALVRFKDLSEEDRRYARDATEASGVLPLLRNSLHYPRGRAAATPLSGLAIAQRVRLVRTDRVEEIEVKPHDVGVVEDVAREAGRVVRVSVRWPSGDQTVHAEGDDDLAAVPGT